MGIYEIVEDERTEQKCRTDYENRWRNECSQKTKEECKDNYRPVKIPYVEDECFTKKEKRCEKHWEEPTPGKKVWVENPATCKWYDASQCAPITKYRTEQERYTQCSKVPYQDCKRVKDTNCNDVPRQECKDIPYQDCQDYQREKCAPVQECQDYPVQKCRDEHKKTPRQVAKQIPVRVCGNRRTPYNEHDQENFEEIVKEKSKENEGDKKEADNDAISFGR